MENREQKNKQEKRQNKNKSGNSNYRNKNRRFNKPNQEKDNPCGYLFNFIRDNIALARGLRFNVLAFDGNSLILSATLKGNENDIGSFFSSSLYAIGQLAAQGIVILKNREMKIKTKLDISKASIKFITPITDYIHIRCSVVDGHWKKFYKNLEKCGNSRMSLTVNIFEKENPNDNCAVLKTEIVAWTKLQ